jgi:ABC-type antimicrobial peptide transport system permease subunit
MGLFGLLSYQVASRTREFGVRMALGAQRQQVLALVLNNGLLLAGIGLVFGVIGGFALRGVIGSMLAGTVYIDRSDAVSLLGSPTVAMAAATVAMVVSAIAASLIPAVRAASVDPMEALRNE